MSSPSVAVWLQPQCAMILALQPRNDFVRFTICSLISVPPVIALDNDTNLWILGPCLTTMQMCHTKAAHRQSMRGENGR